ncbi:MAG: hypothetical protein JSS32_03500 [Verrucomicrobia bacterium]|nr:hypothetical protein [Verrucomicrobiota bacterium]
MSTPPSPARTNSPASVSFPSEFNLADSVPLPAASEDILASVRSAQRVDRQATIVDKAKNYHITFTAPEGVIREFRISKIVYDDPTLSPDYAFTFTFKSDFPYGKDDPKNPLNQLDADYTLHKTEDEAVKSDEEEIVYEILHDDFEWFETVVEKFKQQNWIPHALFYAMQAGFEKAASSFSDESKQG